MWETYKVVMDEVRHLIDINNLKEFLHDIQEDLNRLLRKLVQATWVRETDPANYFHHRLHELRDISYTIRNSGKAKKKFFPYMISPMVIILENLDVQLSNAFWKATEDENRKSKETALLQGSLDAWDAWWTNNFDKVKAGAAGQVSLALRWDEGKPTQKPDGQRGSNHRIAGALVKHERAGLRFEMWANESFSDECTIRVASKQSCNYRGINACVEKQCNLQSGSIKCDYSCRWHFWFAPWSSPDQCYNACADRCATSHGNRYCNPQKETAFFKEHIIPRLDKLLHQHETLWRGVNAHHFIEVKQGNHCPVGYRMVETKEECASITKYGKEAGDGKYVDFRPIRFDEYSKCHGDWPSQGCFAHDNRLFISPCPVQGHSFTTRRHRKICARSRIPTTKYVLAKPGEKACPRGYSEVTTPEECDKVDHFGPRKVGNYWRRAGCRGKHWPSKGCFIYTPIAWKIFSSCSTSHPWTSNRHNKVCKRSVPKYVIVKPGAETCPHGYSEVTTRSECKKVDKFGPSEPEQSVRSQKISQWGCAAGHWPSKGCFIFTKTNEKIFSTCKTTSHKFTTKEHNKVCKEN